MKFCLIWKQGILQKKYDFHKKKMKLLLAGDYEGIFAICGLEKHFIHDEKKPTCGFICMQKCVGRSAQREVWMKGD